MKCKYCAEEILEQAILCRYCGARIVDGRWAPAPLGALPIRSAPPGAATIKLAGYFFLLSAAFELPGLLQSTPLPLFGAMRGGWPAGLIHGLFAVVFFGMGMGLIRRTRLGYLSLFAGTAVYTLYETMYLADAGAREAELRGYAGGSLGALGIDLEQFASMQTLVAWVCLLSWWGFAVYVYIRRASFASHPED